MDVSFISVRKILPALRSVLAPGAEARRARQAAVRGRPLPGRPRRHRQGPGAAPPGAARRGGGGPGGSATACAAPARRPFPGAEGNREFFLHLVAGAERRSRRTTLEACLRKAVSAMNTIGVLARPDLEGGGAHRPRARRVALRARACGCASTTRPPPSAGASLGAGCLVASGREMAGLADALVVLGGDGTLLAASRLLEKPDPGARRQLRQPGLPHRDHARRALPDPRGRARGPLRSTRSAGCCGPSCTAQRPARRDGRRPQRRRDHEGGPLAHHRGGRHGRRPLRLLVPRRRDHRLLAHRLDRLQPRRRRPDPPPDAARGRRDARSARTCSPTGRSS